MMVGATIAPRRLMPLPTTPPEYREWLSSLKDEIHQARRRAALTVNSEMILLYWRIGREIVHGRPLTSGTPASSISWRRTCIQNSLTPEVCRLET